MRFRLIDEEKAHHRGLPYRLRRSYCQMLCLKESGGDPFLLNSINEFDSLNHLRHYL